MTNRFADSFLSGDGQVVQMENEVIFMHELKNKGLR